MAIFTYFSNCGESPMPKPLTRTLRAPLVPANSPRSSFVGLSSWCAIVAGVTSAFASPTPKEQRYKDPVLASRVPTEQGVRAESRTPCDSLRACRVAKLRDARTTDQ